MTQVYEERILRVAVNCANVAARSGVGKFIHVSTGQVYDSSKGCSKETSKLDPWTILAKYHLKAELALKDIPGCVCHCHLIPCFSIGCCVNIDTVSKAFSFWYDCCVYVSQAQVSDSEAGHCVWSWGQEWSQ